jgi:hypothetical protein
MPNFSKMDDSHSFAFLTLTLIHKTHREKIAQGAQRIQHNIDHGVFHSSHRSIVVYRIN